MLKNCRFIFFLKSGLKLPEILMHIIDFIANHNDLIIKPCSFGLLFQTATLLD